MSDPPTRQCGAVRRQGSDVLRCGRSAIHVEQDTDHGDWVTIGALDPDHDGIPLGRILDTLWDDASRDAPNAWRPPDEGDRSVAPTPGKVPPGVELIHAGSIGPRTKGEGMPSAGEMSNIAGQIKEELDTARDLMEQASNIVAQQEAAATQLLDGSSQEVAGAAIQRMRATEMSLDDALANSAIAVEQIAQLIF